MKTKAKWL